MPGSRSCPQMLEYGQCIARRRTERGVVEDAPRGNAVPPQVPQLDRQRDENVILIGGIVDPRRPMESKVRESFPTTGLAIARRSGRIGGDPRDFEINQQAVGAAFEPARVSRLERDAPIEASAQRR